MTLKKISRNAERFWLRNVKPAEESGWFYGSVDNDTINEATPKVNTRIKFHESEILETLTA